MTEERSKVTAKDGGMSPLVQRYVHILLARMAKDEQREIVLAQSEPLPDPFTPPANQLPEGIDYSPVVGELQAVTHGYDTAEYAADSQCEITINKRVYDLGVNVRPASCMVSLVPKG